MVHKTNRSMFSYIVYIERQVVHDFLTFILSVFSTTTKKAIGILIPTNCCSSYDWRGEGCINTIPKYNTQDQTWFRIQAVGSGGG